MKWLFIVVGLISWLSPLLGQEVQQLQFPEFKFESGATVPNVKLAYTTRGVLNEQKSNAILLPSHYSADHTGYDYLIGAEMELDPAKYFLILTNQFANGVSSSPNNTSAPFGGPKFPQVSIRDNIEAQHRLVRDKLGITKLKAVVGFSMGGQQAFQWAVSYPEMMESIVVICGNAKQYPFGIVRLQGSITALKADAQFMDGNYKQPPEKGLRAMGMHYRAWTRSPEAWPRDMFDNMSEQEVEQFLVDASGGFLGADANNLLSQAETWKRHDVGDTQGFAGKLEKALGSIKARVLLMPSTSDQYFPLTDSVFESKLIPNAKLVPIRSVFGHTAGGGTDPDATMAMDAALKEFLNAKGPRAASQSSLEKVQEFFAKFEKGDIPGVLDTMSVDVKWFIPGPTSIPYAGARKGRVEVEKFFGAFANAVEVKEFMPKEFITQDEKVVVLGHEVLKVKSTGREVRNEWIMIFRIDKDKIIDFRSYEDTAALVTAFQK